MTILMNKGGSLDSIVPNKHYSLLLQDDADPNEHILTIQNENLSISDEDDEDDDDDDEDDDGFKSMIGEDEEQEVDDDDDDDEDIDVDDVEGSDEEIFSSNQHRLLSNEGLRHYGQPSFGRKNDYHLLSNNELDHKSGAVFDASQDAIWTPTPMSPVRRAFFLASIMFGVLVVAMFLWALPCDVQPCESELKLKPKQWFSEIDDIGVNYTQLLEKINGDLNLFLSFYKIEKFSDVSSKDKNPASLEPKLNITPTTCGLLSLAEKTGKEKWKLDLIECPLVINCDLLDATGDGLSDCLILGHTSMALMFEPIYGSIFWHVHVHRKEEGPELDFDVSNFHFHSPIVFQDLDGDGFLELLFPIVALPEADKGGKRKHLVLVSGRTGAVIGTPFSISNCFQIVDVLREDASLAYRCSMENRSELKGKIPLSTLLSDIGKDFSRDLYRNDTSFDSQNSRVPPEANDAVCQIRYENKGKCPYCKTRIELGLSMDNPISKEYEYTSVVSSKILAYNNACKGALLKLWKWDPTSLEEAFLQKEAPTGDAGGTPAATTKASVDRQEFDFKLEPSEEYDYSNVYEDEYRENTSEFSNIKDGESSFPPLKPSADQTTSFVTRSRSHRNTLPSSEVRKAKRFFNPPITHKQSSHPPPSATEKLRLSSSSRGTSVADDIRSYVKDDSSPSLEGSSKLLPPSGYRLQKLEEVLVLLTFNGTDWNTQELGSMKVYQLCQQQCIPSCHSQKNSAMIDVNSLKLLDWYVYVSSSSFSSLREEKNNATHVSWSFESYIRKLIVPVGVF